MLKSPFKTEDENTIFCTALRSLASRSPEDINAIISEFGPENKAKVTDLLSKTQFKFVDNLSMHDLISPKLIL